MLEEDREFVGFFLGEGHLGVHVERLKSSNSPSGVRLCYAPVVQISMRADELPILQWCKRRFGGNVYQYKQRKIKGYKGREYLQAPVAMWTTRSVKRCYTIIQLLKQVKLPSIKRKQIEVFERFLRLKIAGNNRSHGFGKNRFTDEEMEEMRKCKETLSSMKIFSKSEVTERI